MSTLLARTGRHRQRYEDNLCLVSGCIPYRLLAEIKGQTPDIETSIEVLMISSPNRDDLVFPKGGWEDDETVEEAACREALEEAGVKGVLNGNRLGIWEFKSKSRQHLCSLKGGCRGYMFALEVTEELEIWPEQENHQRKWLKITEAFELCRYDWMRCALDAFLQLMGYDRILETRNDVVESPSLVVPDVIVDCQIISSNCYVKQSNSQKHALSHFSWQIPLKRLPLV